MGILWFMAGLGIGHRVVADGRAQTGERLEILVERVHRRCVEIALLPLRLHDFNEGDEPLAVTFLRKRDKIGRAHV